MYDINYNDDRFKDVENQKQNALNNVNNTYNEMINSTDNLYSDLNKATQDYAETQKKLQQENTDFAIEKINQQKQKAESDYLKEQKGAYSDYQKATDQYGINAENMASMGLQNSGYSETSRINAFNTYQNRYAQARKSFNELTMNYDNNIKEAQLANNSKLAEIAFNALKTGIETTIQGFQYKNTLLQSKLTAQNEVDDRYYTRWNDVLQQMNTENTLKENIRQYNETMAYQKERDAVADSQWEKQFAASQASSRSSGSGNSKSSNEITTAYYSGKIPSATANSAESYGTFSNGYQPKGIVGYGTLESTGEKTKVNSTTLNGTKTVTTQKIWKTADGTKWWWNGMAMKYEKYE